MKLNKIVLIALLIGLTASFFIFDIGQYMNLAFLKSKQIEIETFYVNRPIQTVLLFFFTYVIFTGLSLPAASILTLAGGAIFGLFVGTILVSFASTIGATLAFLASRYLFRDSIQQRFAEKLQVINRGIEKDGAFYLFTMRLVPAFPFFIVNLVMGLTPIPTLTFAFVSQIGMLAATVVFVNAGTQLARISEPGDILSPALITSFVLLGLFPLIAKKSVDLFRSRGPQNNIEKDNE
ncbi:MAG: putative membrane protein YdjX (TVP38/TMEM64 family) [Gammaproteobacteria bacterium]|jgi:uncharacterized membrane protein YdjX (TVP38/TMEM64 family)